VADRRHGVRSVNGSARLPQMQRPFRKGMRLPWAGNAVPHATLDLLRGCNVACPGCYNTRPPACKPLSQIKAELRQLLTLRRLQAVTLLGGEPTLHPHLIDVVRYAAAHRLRVALLTNGVLLCPGLIAALRRAGLSVVYLHIQSGQRRPDCRNPGDLMALRTLRQEKAELIAWHGLQAGIAMIGYRGKLEELRDVVEEVLGSPWVTYLLVTEYTDLFAFMGLTGDLRAGLRGGRDIGVTQRAEGHPGRGEELDTQTVAELMADAGFEPFAYLGSSEHCDEPRWLLYRAGVIRTSTGDGRVAAVSPGWSDRLLIRLPYWCTGRYWFFHRSYPNLFRIQLLLSALSGGTCLRTLSWLARSCWFGATVEEKHLLFQQGPTVTPEGRVVLCRDCPDATVVDGRLMPVCLIDRLAG